MSNAPADAVCSACGRPGSREDMFGAPPDLLCEACARGLRERLAPRAAGRLLSDVVTGVPVVTFAIVIVAALLHMGFARGEGLVLRSRMTMIDVVDLARGVRTLEEVRGVYTGEFWRLLTSTMLHVNFVHILFNCLMFLQIGRAVELGRGPWLFLLLFVSSAFASASLSWIFEGNSVGLSGVLYALAGFLWARRKVDPVAAAVMNPSLTRALAVWFVACIAMTALDVMRIANWGHGGGAAFGIAAGRASISRWRWPAFAVIGVVTVGLVVLATHTWPLPYRFG